MVLYLYILYKLFIMSEIPPCNREWFWCDCCHLECTEALKYYKKWTQNILDFPKEWKKEVDISKWEYRALYVNFCEGRIVNIGFKYENEIKYWKKEYSVRFDNNNFWISNIEIAERVKSGYWEYQKVGKSEIEKFIREVLKNIRE